MKYIYIYALSKKKKLITFFKSTFIFLSHLLVPIEENNDKSFIKIASFVLRNTVRQTFS